MLVVVFFNSLKFLVVNHQLLFDFHTFIHTPIKIKWFSKTSYEPNTQYFLHWFKPISQMYFFKLNKNKQIRNNTNQKNNYVSNLYGHKCCSY